MDATPHLSESLIRGRAAATVFARGQEYYEQGAVLTVARRGADLLAAVEGSDYAPYHVQIRLDAGGVMSAHCSCPYDLGGDCKHIVAVLLTALHKPAVVETRPLVATLLADLSPDQLRTLLTTLTDQQPDLADMIEVQVALLTHAPPTVATSPSTAPPAVNPQSAIPNPQSAAPRPRQTPLDAQTFQRQVRAMLHSGDRMSSSDRYGMGSEVVTAIQRIADQAQPFLDAGDGRNAMVILEAVTAETVQGWEEVAEEDEFTDLFQDLGQFWAEAVLVADLTAAERRRWTKQFAAWQEALNDYGVDAVFQAAEEATRQGWDDPDLLRVLQGTDKGAGLWPGDRPDYADDLAVARLNILARQGRTQEHLRLAAAEGQHAAYATMLIGLGRVTEALDYGLRHVATPDAALPLAQALRGHGDLDAAIHLAEHGLTLPGDPLALARWLRDLATGLDRPAVALQAAQMALRDSIGLADYQALQTVAGAAWPPLREALLARLRGTRGGYSTAGLDIFLHEGLIDDAIAGITPGTYYVEVARVVDAAIPVRPEWAGQAAWQQARAIIDAKRANHYSDAMRWLERAYSAAAQGGQAAAWRAGVQALLAEHRRKYSLVPLLEALLSRHRA